jgi:carbamoyltransferase
MADKTQDYFKISSNGRFMNIAFEANSYAKARIPAVVHYDDTTRLQAVYPTDSPLFYELLKIIGEKTGDPVLLNTSFNTCGEPIVDSPTDAINSYSKMPINSLVMGEYIIRKR